jgi:hypothetical protein
MYAKKRNDSESPWEYTVPITLNGQHIQYADGFMYVCDGQPYTFDDFGMDIFMSVGCIRLRLIEKRYKQRWYTISSSQIDPGGMHERGYEDIMGIKYMINVNRDVMDYMWRVLPQPIAEEVCVYFFW